MADPTPERVLAAVLKVDAMSTDIAEIKDTMKSMAVALNKLAVIEERQAHDRAEIARLFKRQDNHDDRIGELEKAQPMQRHTTDWFNRIAFMVISAVVTAVLTTVIVQRSAHEKASAVPVLTMPTK
jgi:hypothetical protein